MEATKLVVSLETAKRLKESGFPQGKSYWEWVKPQGSEQWYLQDDYFPQADEMVSAPTTDELLAELPITTVVKQEDNSYSCFNPTIPVGTYVKKESLPEALAELWLKVKGNDGEDNKG